MGKTITAVNIKKLWYGDTSKINAKLTGVLLFNLLKTATEVKNVHGETWTLEEAEANKTNYKNQLTGQAYRYDTTQGEITPQFSIGQYDYAAKAALMGGEVIKKGGAGTDKDDIVGWKRATDKVVIKKALFCLTEDDVWFIFPNCQIVAREANTDKAIAIAVKGLVQAPTVDGVSPEYNFDESEVKALA